MSHRRVGIADQNPTGLSHEEFVMLEEELQDYEDLKELRAAKVEEAKEPGLSLDDVKKELGL